MLRVGSLASLLLALASLLSTAPAAAQIELGPGDDVEGALNALAPGDEVVLADGTYTLTSRFSFSAAGTAAEPILIRAAEGARPHFERPAADQNIWDIEEARHLTLRGLTFSGGSAGLRVSAASDFTIEGCEIFDTADVALRMNDGGTTYERISILRNHIHDTGGTGEGMYLGCNRDGCRIAGGLIAENHVHHTNAGDVSQGDGIELKEGSHGVTIRDNVIHDTNYPCLLGYSTVGNGEPNVVDPWPPFPQA
ncbi:MAG TPA: right-handed parallel beta-helix repeat-containing protein, partial [Polyangiaceae bacterium LLY-WYZ-15_(1-7)]|nr:right-handed parallel beta-helix repeat-containing protein [Polyangiaceae bacterium LLY-WYZ-15_(1-7)]